MLSLRDAPTAVGVSISGTVEAIVSDTRVYLCDVTVGDGRTLSRSAVVTLMSDAEDIEGTAVRVGQRVQGTGRLFSPDEPSNPGDVDGRMQALCLGYELSGYLIPGWTAEGEAVFSVRETLRQIRTALSKRMEALFGEERAPLFQAVLLGDRSQMEADAVQAMRLTGLVHLLSVSGLHLSLVAAALRVGLRQVPMGRRMHFLLTGICLGIFTCLTGAAVGTLRALVMALLRELAALAGRRYDALTALGTAALLITFVQPLWALNAAFQFSFLVVLGILLLHGQLTKHIHDLAQPARWMAGSAIMSATAQLAALPMQLMLYGFVPLFALPMNILAGALMPAILLGGWMCAMVSLACMPLARALAMPIGWVGAQLEDLCQMAASVKGGILRLPAPYSFSVLFAMALMAAVSRQIYMKRGRKLVCILLTAGLVVSYGLRFDPSVRYVQLDVGQGDGALVRSGREAVLIDVGPVGEYAMLRYLRHEGLSVSLVILSHLDADHAGALDVLLSSEVEIERIAMAREATEDLSSQSVAQALETARERGISLETYERGEMIEAGAFQFAVLSPDESLTGSNERSLVLSAQIGEASLLTLGDLPAASEREDFPDCDILKVAHHGSQYATSAQLLMQTTPEIALISVGANSYGHPTQRVLEDLEAVGAQIYRTDESGCITIYPKASGLIVKTYR